MPYEADELIFREGKKEDIPVLLSLIKKIAIYEKMEDQVEADEKTLEEEIFVKKRCSFFLLRLLDKDIGYALYFFNFSTFKGHSGLYLEDLYILPEYRHKGYGKKTFKRLAQLAFKEGCPRMEWVCLKWNKPSLSFYSSLGAEVQDEWNLVRLDEEGIKKLADEPSSK